MKPTKIKLVTIISEPIIATQIEQEIRDLGATGTTSTQVHGEGSHHRHSGEIPGSKVKIECIVPPDIAQKIMEHISQTYFEDYSVITYSTDVEVLRAKKFE